MAAKGEMVQLPHSGRFRDATNLLGMRVFLGSWVVTFGALFCAYGFMRAESLLPWPPLNVPHLPLGRPGLNTLAVALGSVSLRAALRAVRRGASSRAEGWTWLAVGLASLFLVLQIDVWADLWRAGLVVPESGRYASAFYTLTGFHALHVAVGVVGLAALAVFTRRGHYTPARCGAIRLWALYWDFVGAVWIVIYLLLYVV